jgi:serine/threonine protein kinase
MINKIKNKDLNGLLTLKGLMPVFKQIAYALDHFRKSYNFFHRDFHLGNFMALEDGTIKIIDFGLSCIRLNNNDGVPTIYSNPTGNTPVQDILKRQMASDDNSCASLDILMLITSMYELLMPRNIFDVETSIFFELLYLYMPDGGVVKINILSQSLVGLQTSMEYLRKKPYEDALIIVNSKIANLGPNSKLEFKEILLKKKAKLQKLLSEVTKPRLFWTTYPDSLNKYVTLFTSYGDPFINFRTENFRKICDDPLGFLTENEIYISSYLIVSVIPAQRKSNPYYLPALPNTIYLKLLDKNYKNVPNNENLKDSMPVAKQIPEDNKVPLEIVLSSGNLVPNDGLPRAVGWAGWAKGLWNKAKETVKRGVTRRGGKRAPNGSFRKNKTLRYV